MNLCLAPQLAIGPWIVLGSFVFAVLGLMLGVRAIFSIKASDGRLSGYPLAILAVLFSTGTMFGLISVIFVVKTVQRRVEPMASPSPTKKDATAERGFRRLEKIRPPDGWFQGEPSIRRFRGPAGGSEEGPEMKRIIEKAEIDGFESSRVVEMVVRSERANVRGEPVEIWFALLDQAPTPGEQGFAAMGSGSCVILDGRLVMGIFGPSKGPLVERVGEHYRKEMADIPDSMK